MVYRSSLTPRERQAMREEELLKRISELEAERQELRGWLEEFCVWADNNLVIVLPNKERRKNEWIIPSEASWDDLANIRDWVREALAMGLLRDLNK